MNHTTSTALSQEGADYTIRIGTGLAELAPARIVSTITFNRRSPGPLLRSKESQRAVEGQIEARR